MVNALSNKSMILEYRQIIGLELLSLTGMSAGTVTDIFINPKNCRLECLIVDKQKFIKTIDIRNWDRQNLDFNNIKNIKSLENYDHTGQSIIDRRVFSERKKYLGNVKNYLLDTNLNSVTDLVVSKKIFLIFNQERLVNWREIVKITPQKVIVKQNLRPKKSKEQVALEANL